MVMSGCSCAVRVVRLIADALAARCRRPRPSVCSRTCSTGSTLESSIGDRADRFRQPQPVGVTVDDHHLAGALDHRRVGGHQPDRAGAVDDDRVAGLHAGQLGGVVAGREDVGQHHVVGLAAPRASSRQTQAVEVAIRHAQVLGLAAVVGAHVGEAVGGAGHARVGLRGQAEGGQAAFAVLAEAAGDVEGQAHPVPDLDPVDAAPTSTTCAEVLVTEHAARLQVGAALVHVKIGPTDVGVRDLDQDVGRLLDLRVRHVLYTEHPEVRYRQVLSWFYPCDLRRCDPLCRKSEEKLKRMAHAATERLDGG